MTTQYNVSYSAPTVLFVAAPDPTRIFPKTVSNIGFSSVYLSDSDSLSPTTSLLLYPGESVTLDNSSSWSAIARYSVGSTVVVATGAGASNHPLNGVLMSSYYYSGTIYNSTIYGGGTFSPPFASGQIPVEGSLLITGAVLDQSSSPIPTNFRYGPNSSVAPASDTTRGNLMTKVPLTPVWATYPYFLLTCLISGSTSYPNGSIVLQAFYSTEIL